MKNYKGNIKIKAFKNLIRYVWIINRLLMVTNKFSRLGHGKVSLK